jgi:hypothetical protein
MLVAVIVLMQPDVFPLNINLETSKLSAILLFIPSVYRPDYVKSNFGDTLQRWRSTRSLSLHHKQDVANF